MSLERLNTRILSVALVTSGPNAAESSILDLAAVWVCGGEGEFSERCSMFDGARFLPIVEQVSGISEAQARESVELPSEGETIVNFAHWCGAFKKPFMLAGFKPATTRAFLLKAAQRAGYGGRSGASRRPAPMIPISTFDLGTLYMGSCLSEGMPVATSGVSLAGILAGSTGATLPPRSSALAIARLKAAAFRELLGA